ncbi:MAG TPA: hypothetical protein VMY99_04055 [Nevskiaceae bacterium]|nr:hypothetical protein [Nevskiaceae bacterium]
MAKQKRSVRGTQEPDGSYLLKLVLYVIVGSLWLRITTRANTQIPVPAGLIIGLLFASHEHFRIDRKIEYAVLLVAMLMGYLVPAYGLYINL